MARVSARLARLERRAAQAPPPLDRAAWAAAAAVLAAEGAIYQNAAGQWVPTDWGGILRGALLIALRVAADSGHYVGAGRHGNDSHAHP